MSRNSQAPFKQLLTRAGITALLLVLADAASHLLIMTIPPYEVLLVFAIGIALIGWAGASFWRYLRTQEVAIGVGRFRYVYPDVSYTYTFDGRPFVGNRASIEPENIWTMDSEMHKVAWSEWRPGDALGAAALRCVR